MFVVLLASLTASAAAQGAGTPVVTGQLSLSPVYTAGTAPTYGIELRPLDFTSNSRLSLDYGAATVNLLVVKPTTFVRAEQPEQFYTIETTAHGQTLRVGDLSPRFTDNTTGYGRIHGAEAQFVAGRVAQLNVVRGLSQRATPTAGYFLGTYKRSFTGARLALSPVHGVALGLNAVHTADDPVTASIAGPAYAPMPGANLLFGSDLTLSFLKRRRASLALEYAASVLTDDLGAPDSLGRVRGEPLSPRAFAEWGVVRRFVPVNDSTRVGRVLAAKLTLPIGASRTTLDYRQASPLFGILSMPWAQTGERLRVQHATPLFGRAVQVMASGEIARTDPTRYQPFATRTLTGVSNVALARTPVGRVTVGVRANRRTNDAPAPDAGRFDRRMDATTLSPSLAVTRDVRLGLPLALTTTVTATRYGDRFRPAYASRTAGVQVQAQTPDASRVLLNAQARYALTTRPETGGRRSSAELLVREGYGIRPQRLAVFLINGVALERAPEWQQTSTLWTYGGGARWTPTDATGLELEWQSRRMLDLTLPDYDQHNLELRLTHRW